MTALVLFRRRQLRARASILKHKQGVVTVPADYSQLGELLIVQLIIAISVPFTAIAIIRMLRLRSA